jgi:U3 small nucleolar RNA-associated protein 13
MASRQTPKTTFGIDRTIRPIFTGGAVAIDNAGQTLASTVEGDVNLLDPVDGRQLAQIEGVSIESSLLGTR